MFVGLGLKGLKFKFGYTGIRVRDLDGAIAFFTKYLGMKVRSRVKADWTKGEFASLVSAGEKHWLELNWYSDESTIAALFREGEELDHLGFEVDDFDGTLKRLNAAGYPTKIGPIKMGVWDVAFVQGFENIWLDVYRIRKKAKPRK
jgi:catechol 2,3-dioxygenase-like lactoylglutathione lyase family enzyme